MKRIVSLSAKVADRFRRTCADIKNGSDNCEPMKETGPVTPSDSSPVEKNATKAPTWAQDQRIRRLYGPESVISRPPVPKRQTSPIIGQGPVTIGQDVRKLIADLGRKDRKDRTAKKTIELIRQDPSVAKEIIAAIPKTKASTSSELVNLIIAASSGDAAVQSSILYHLINNVWPDAETESIAVKIMGIIGDRSVMDHLRNVQKDEGRDFIVRFWANVALDEAGPRWS